MAKPGWRTSTHRCHANNACVEVAEWRTASASRTADCVSVAVIEED